MLTPKQEKFCQCIVSGMSGKDSYITAYDSKGSDQNAYNEASKLLMREDIQARLTVLRKPIEKAAQQTALSEREKKRSFLWEVIADDTQSMSDRLKSMDLLNKMDAEYLNVNVNKNETEVNLSGIDLNTLRTLSD